MMGTSVKRNSLPLCAEKCDATASAQLVRMMVDGGFATNQQRLKMK
jgi:hypothetical protein